MADFIRVIRIACKNCGTQTNCNIAFTYVDGVKVMPFDMGWWMLARREGTLSSLVVDFYCPDHKPEDDGSQTPSPS